MLALTALSPLLSLSWPFLRRLIQLRLYDDFLDQFPKLSESAATAQQLPEPNIFQIPGVREIEARLHASHTSQIKL